MPICFTHLNTYLCVSIFRDPHFTKGYILDAIYPLCAFAAAINILLKGLSENTPVNRGNTRSWKKGFEILSRNAG